MEYPKEGEYWLYDNKDLYKIGKKHTDTSFDVIAEKVRDRVKGTLICSAYNFNFGDSKKSWTKVNIEQEIILW